MNPKQQSPNTLSLSRVNKGQAYNHTFYSLIMTLAQTAKSDKQNLLDVTAHSL